MRKNRVITLLTVLLLLPTMQTVSGCDKTSQDGKVEVWSTNSTLKVMQSGQTYEKKQASIDVVLCKGETESAQIVVTASSDVANFDLQKSEIKNTSDEAFGIDNIAVYVQKYCEVTQKTYGQNNTAYPTGMIPDMLLPIEVSKAYGENSIRAGNNQSFTVEFTANSETTTGNYSGEFSLVIDGETTKIPVSVEVCDIDVSKCYGKSIVIIDAYQLKYGELNNTDAMYKTYYDTLLNDYKTCAGYLPNSYNFDQYLETLDYYWDNPNFTTYVIPTTGTWYIDYEMLYDYVYLLAKSSTPEKIYLEKACVYPFDEPEMNNPDVDMRIEVIDNQIDEVRNQVYNRLLEEGFFNAYGGEDGEFADKIRESLDFPSIITSSDIDYWGENIDTYCPPIQYYENSINRDKYATYAQDTSTEQWYYTCLQPVYPYPTNHIDDYLIGYRSMRWIQKSYDLDGYLFWCTNLYSINEGDGHTAIDPYTTAGRFYYNGGTYNGDGFLFYPAIKYSAEKPFGSLRLMALRDGQEDYNLICEYENILNTLTEKYALSAIDVNDILSNIYDYVFSKVQYNTSSDDFDYARKALIQQVELANSEYQFFTQSSNVGGVSTTNFYASPNTELYIDGVEQIGQACGDGIQFSKTFATSGKQTVKIKLVQNGESVEFNYDLINSQIVQAQSIMENTYYQASEDTTLSLGADNASIAVNLVCKGQTIIEMASFVPYFSITAKAFGENNEKTNKITFKLTNNSSQDRQFFVALKYGTRGNSNVDVCYVKAGETVDVSVSNIQKTLSSLDGTFGGITIKFDNVITGTTELYNPAEIVISDIQVIKED